jgi:hypothetical protein
VAGARPSGAYFDEVETRDDGDNGAAGEAAIEQAVGEDFDDRKFDFELRLTRLVGTLSPRLIHSFRKILAEQPGTDLAYAAFYTSHIYFRRMKEQSELSELMATFGDSYRSRPTYPHLKSLSLAADPREVESAVHCAEAAKEAAPRHAGVLHNYALATIHREEARATPDPERLVAARQALDAALAETHGSYARYHATYATLFLLDGDYARAEEEVNQAIDREEPTNADYALRIGEYQAIKIDIKVRQSLRAITAEQGNAIDEVRSLQQGAMSQLEQIRSAIEGRIGEARAESLQLLGLLAAVVAFVVSASSIAAQLRTFAVSGRLFVMLTAAILVIYAGFGVAFLRPNAVGSIRNVAVLGLGLGIGAFALFGWHVA